MKVDVNDLLERGSFYRKAYAGIFHMLPLGLRVQDKLERLIDRHMQSLGASKVSLSSISSEELWEKSGRLQDNSEYFSFRDRKEARFLLAPTHEEEITALVASSAQSYKVLPVRLYQISRKYRDEPRPRQGLLRGREFIMKDLYTFDHNVESALRTYEAVKNAYTRLFNELKIPYLMAAADSGNMGGSMSHEFHYKSLKGEDTIVSCDNCDAVYNDELADGLAPSTSHDEQADSAPGFDLEGKPAPAGARVSTGLWTTISKDKRTLVRVWYPKFTVHERSNQPIAREVNTHAIKAIGRAAGYDLDTGVENPLEQWTTHVQSSKAAEDGSTERPQVLDVYDSHVHAYTRPPLKILEEAGCAIEDVECLRLDTFPETSRKLSVTRVHTADQCPKCTQGVLTAQTTVELGHTFHLGTRYSEVLGARIVNSENERVPMQMGCHGIGVSRMITAVADSLADEKGLNWPKVIAPWEVVVVPAPSCQEDAVVVYDLLASDKASPIDVLLDDRDKTLGWKLGDADLIGYPVIIIVGSGWKKNRTLEVQCRRLGIDEDVPVGSVLSFVQSLLTAL
ncbi:putative proline--tRNA ligase AIM10 [Aspergillus mulundensis]|uniref:proline--tRNA ligase n=1 Tax=Aspergillus mulundensis TaxID=1810919 RepID=A0A3D8RRM9_9EURO|nr:Uncharacterized protein DSM5745_06443 [Aspergillus mulundensis]RDW76451.1 Uncharacterized protein DSM5745_06443 [Aspergillus mulundensis]